MPRKTKLLHFSWVSNSFLSILAAGQTERKQTKINIASLNVAKLGADGKGRTVWELGPFGSCSDPSPSIGDYGKGRTVWELCPVQIQFGSVTMAIKN